MYIHTFKMTTVIQRSRSTAKVNEGDVETYPEVPAAGVNGNGQSGDKTSRIAANLARLDAAPSLIRAPLQWKGYGWRFTRAFNDPLVSNGSSSGETFAAAQEGSDETWKQWAISGVKRRSIKVILIVLIFTAIVVLSAVMAFASFYALIVSRDPCVVAVETMQRLNEHPRKSALVPTFVPKLPKIIHQQWKTDKIPDGVYSKWNAQFKELYPEPEYKHMLWTDANARELIKKDFPFFLPAYDNYEFGIQRADASRYFIMYKYGGLYADLDYEPLINFWEHLPKDRVALIESPYAYNEKSQNSLMSSPVNDPFWNQTFALLLERKDKAVLQATGPMFLDVLLKRATESYTLLPCENFQRLPLHLSADEEVSPFLSQVHRELLGRLTPMKSCGDYHNKECLYGKHHNTASYLPDTGVIKLLWN